VVVAQAENVQLQVGKERSVDGVSPLVVGDGIAVVGDGASEAVDRLPYIFGIDANRRDAALAGQSHQQHGDHR